MKTARWMKHLFLGVLVLGALAAGNANAVNPVDKGFMVTELYLWNRLADLMEVLRGGVAVGPAIGAEVAVTQYLQLGAYTDNEEGVSFPNFLPPLWLITKADGEQVFRDHSGRYWTYSVGPYRKELTQAKDVRFRRAPWDVRAQVGLGIAQVYLAIDAKQTLDFLAGFLTLDPAKDDQQLGVVVKRQPARQLGRGICNLALGIIEVPVNIESVNKDQGGFAAVTYGLCRGLWRFGIREVTGVFETVTFPFGWGPIVEPEFPFQPVRDTEWRINPLPFAEQ